MSGGCQGEPMSALSRLALDDHKDFKIEAGDTVVLSARMIPGNERAIGRMMDHFYRRRADIYYPDGSQPPVHVSGHASEEELKLVVTLVKPQILHSDSRNVPAASPAREAGGEDGASFRKGSSLRRPATSSGSDRLARRSSAKRRSAAC